MAFVAHPEQESNTLLEGLEDEVPAEHLLASIVRAAATEGQGTLKKVQTNVDLAFVAFIVSFVLLTVGLL